MKLKSCVCMSTSGVFWRTACQTNLMYHWDRTTQAAIKNGIWLVYPAGFQFSIHICFICVCQIQRQEHTSMEKKMVWIVCASVCSTSHAYSKTLWMVPFLEWNFPDLNTQRSLLTLFNQVTAADKISTACANDVCSKPLALSFASDFTQWTLKLEKQITFPLIHCVFPLIELFVYDQRRWLKRVG